MKGWHFLRSRSDVVAKIGAVSGNQSTSAAFV
jgi:hypothetical protein